jgi:hypothetical protein
MQRLFAGAAAAAALAAVVLPAAAPGAPKPPYTASCVIGSETRADWQHAKLVQVGIDWSAPAGSGVSFTHLDVPVLSPTPPHGVVSTATPRSGDVQPVSATFTFTHTDGSVDTVTTACA